MREETYTRLELGHRSEASENALAHLILVRVQKGKRASELSRWVGLGKVLDLLRKVLVVDAIVKVGSRETISMALERVDLLYLAAIWKANVVDTKVALSIVDVGRDLTPVLGNDIDVRDDVC